MYCMHAQLLCAMPSRPSRAIFSVADQVWPRPLYTPFAESRVWIPPQRIGYQALQLLQPGTTLLVLTSCISATVLNVLGMAPCFDNVSTGISWDANLDKPRVLGVPEMTEGPYRDPNMKVEGALQDRLPRTRRRVV